MLLEQEFSTFWFGDQTNLMICKSKLCLSLLLILGYANMVLSFIKCKWNKLMDDSQYRFEINFYFCSIIYTTFVDNGSQSLFVISLIKSFQIEIYLPYSYIFTPTNKLLYYFVFKMSNCDRLGIFKKVKWSTVKNNVDNLTKD